MIKGREVHGAQHQARMDAERRAPWILALITLAVWGSWTFGFQSANLSDPFVWISFAATPLVFLGLLHHDTGRNMLHCGPRGTPRAATGPDGIPAILGLMGACVWIAVALLPTPWLVTFPVAALLILYGRLTVRLDAGGATRTLLGVPLPVLASVTLGGLFVVFAARLLPQNPLGPWMLFATVSAGVALSLWNPDDPRTGKEAPAPRSSRSGEPAIESRLWMSQRRLGALKSRGKDRVNTKILIARLEAARERHVHERTQSEALLAEAEAYLEKHDRSH